MLFGNARERLRVEGLMPERALLRLKRTGISLYQVKKTQKNALLFTVKRKDIEKVFAIYPNVCYNSSEYHPYTITRLGSVGWGRAVDFCQNRAGAMLGVLAFAVLTLAADGLVLGVDFVGSQVYAREIKQALAENGVRAFSLYPKGKEDLVTAKLLSLPDVEFCSVKKQGLRVVVETRLSGTQKRTPQEGVMTAKYNGELVAISVLRGSALKKIGDKITVGEALVGDWFETEEGGQVRVQPIARVRIACTHEGVYEAEDEERAFAAAYLELDLVDASITEKSVAQTKNGFHVKISYVVTQTINFDSAI